ncbi:hypothetical protein AAHC03_01461 [Spirometra sp. Aus1]
MTGSLDLLTCCLNANPKVEAVEWHLFPNVEEQSNLETAILTRNLRISGRDGVKWQAEINENGDWPDAIEYVVHHSECLTNLVSVDLPYHAGLYVCRGRNKLGWGAYSRPTKLFVKNHLKSLSGPEAQYLSKSANFALSVPCEASKYPLRNVTWRVLKVMEAKLNPQPNNTNTSYFASTVSSPSLRVWCPGANSILCWNVKEEDLSTVLVVDDRATLHFASDNAIESNIIYACIASNESGRMEIHSQISIRQGNSVRRETALGIRLLRSFACAVEIRYEVFRWTMNSLPQKEKSKPSQCDLEVHLTQPEDANMWTKRQLSQSTSDVISVTGLKPDSVYVFVLSLLCNRSSEVKSNLISARTRRLSASVNDSAETLYAHNSQVVASAYGTDRHTRVTTCEQTSLTENDQKKLRGKFDLRGQNSSGDSVPKTGSTEACKFVSVCDLHALCPLNASLPNVDNGKHLAPHQLQKITKTNKISKFSSTQDRTDGANSGKSRSS